jgi:DNA mismatch endonuclease, patch repair protein
MDIFSKEKRSEVMSRIKGQDTKLEVTVRSRLFKDGYRFRKNDKRYPGKPDILLPRYKTAIFINGCFWHGHKGCKYSVVPKTRTEFWVNKINTNIKNDKKTHTLLKEMGWKVIVSWECELKKDFDFQFSIIIRCLNKVSEKL